MVKANIMTFDLILRCTLLRGLLFNGLHAAELEHCVEDLTELHHHTAEWVINAGSCHQEHEEKEQIQFALCQQQRPHQHRGWESQSKEHLRGSNHQAAGHFIADGGMYDPLQLFIQPCQVGILLVVGFQIPDALQKLLDSVGGIQLGLDLFQVHMVLQSLAPHKDKDRQDKGRQNRQRHSPVHEKQAQADDHTADGRSENLGNCIGKDSFQVIAVAHHGSGQVGKVPLAKEGQRQGA